MLTAALPGRASPTESLSLLARDAEIEGLRAENSELRERLAFLEAQVARWLSKAAKKKANAAREVVRAALERASENLAGGLKVEVIPGSLSETASARSSVTMCADNERRDSVEEPVEATLPLEILPLLARAFDPSSPELARLMQTCRTAYFSLLPRLLETFSTATIFDSPFRKPDEAEHLFDNFLLDRTNTGKFNYIRRLETNLISSHGPRIASLCTNLVYLNAGNAAPADLAALPSLPFLQSLTVRLVMVTGESEIGALAALSMPSLRTLDLQSPPYISAINLLHSSAPNLESATLALEEDLYNPPDCPSKDVSLLSPEFLRKVSRYRIPDASFQSRMLLKNLRMRIDRTPRGRIAPFAPAVVELDTDALGSSEPDEDAWGLWDELVELSPRRIEAQALSTAVLVRSVPEGCEELHVEGLRLACENVHLLETGLAEIKVEVTCVFENPRSAAWDKEKEFWDARVPGGIPVVPDPEAMSEEDWRRYSRW